MRQIQKHRVEIDHKPITGTSRISPDQSDLFAALKLTAPTESTAL